MGKFFTSQYNGRENDMTMRTDSQSPLASTAHWTAAVRALENDRADRLFADSWAAALAGEDGATWLADRSPDSVIPIVLRTRFFDDFLKRITTQEMVQQIVLLAAGLDTRAFRLTWPAGTQVFELDQPVVMYYKDKVLRSEGAQPACGRKPIEVDLTATWHEALVQADFDPGRLSGWLLEGFLYYLPNERVTQILDEVSNLAAPGSWLGFDIINSLVLTSPWTRPWVNMQASYGAPWIGFLDDPSTFLQKRGWEVVLSQAGQPEANHGRWKLPIIPVTQPDMPHNWYVVAQKA
jgi:methyltransferase (TIGR00027 family)